MRQVEGDVGTLESPDCQKMKLDCFKNFPVFTMGKHSILFFPLTLSICCMTLLATDKQSYWDFFLSSPFIFIYVAYDHNQMRHY